MAKTLKTKPRSQRVRDDDSTDEPYSDELEGSSPSVMIDGEDVGSSDEEEGEDSAGEDEEDRLSEGAEYVDVSDIDSEEEGDRDGNYEVQKTLNKVSFGDLAKAQSKVSQEATSDRKRKRGAGSSADTEAKLEALRERLRELREAKGIPSDKPSAKASKVTDEGDHDNSCDSGSDDSSDAPEAPSAKRSKHAPMSTPSNKAVSRKRTVIASNKVKVRDPRFMPVSGVAPSSEYLAKNYDFLDAYRKDEIADLKSQLGETTKGKKKQPQPKKKATKLSEEDQARLRKELLRMESQEQSRKEKQRLEDVTKKHKREEKDKIAQGKSPYFLKKSDQKKLALTEKFEGMKAKQRDKALDRRRKKISQREKRSMPSARRGVPG